MKQFKKIVLAIAVALAMNGSALYADDVTPIYANHNRVPGNTPTMTNIQAWASSMATSTKNYTDAATNATLIAAKDYTDAAISGAGQVTPLAVTNIAGRVTSNVVTKAYVDGLGISSMTTNDVCAIVTNSVNGGAWVTNITATLGGKPITLLNVVWGYGSEFQNQWVMKLNVPGLTDPVSPCVAPNNADPDATELEASFYLGLKTTRGKNSLGLAYDRDVVPTVTQTVTKAYVESLGIEAGTSAATVTNIATAVVVPATNAVLLTADDRYFKKSDNSVARVGVELPQDNYYGSILGNDQDSHYGAAVIYSAGIPAAVIGDYATSQGEAFHGLSWLISGSSAGYPRVTVGSDDSDRPQITFTDSAYGINFKSSGRKESRLTVDNSPVATSNMVNVIAYPKASGTTLETTVGQWENYWGGSNICWEVTNYYGQVDIPKLRLLELVTTNGTTAYREVWNDITKFNIFQTNTTQTIQEWAVNYYNTNVITKIEGKADKAWGKYTSSGGEAPSNQVWHTAPTTVFAGGYEYQRFAVGAGSIAVLTSKGAPTYTAGSEGKFRIGDDGGTNYFGFAKTDSYTIGTRTDGITVSGTEVTLEYDTIGESFPIIYYSPNVTSANWEQLNNADGTPITGATYQPTFTTHTDYIDAKMNVGSAAIGFFKAETTVSGSAVFETNMKANLIAGIVCTNTSLKANGVIRPSYNGSTVTWTWSLE